MEENHKKFLLVNNDIFVKEDLVLGPDTYFLYKNGCKNNYII